MYMIRIMRVVAIMVIIHIVLIFFLIQVRIDLGLADHVWQNKRNAIAQEVDGLGAQFRPAMRAGWLKYIKDTYTEEEDAVGPSVRQGTLILDDQG